ncbi:MAG: VCBS repeat-containing protein [Candidatus Latescibacterota bacterium]
MRPGKEPVWVQRGFEDFSKGRFDNGGDNLYVNANGIIEMIHRFDVNNDGCVDIVLPNSHGYIERGPTWIYTQAGWEGSQWPRQELPNDSGWMSRAVDVDGDGYLDLIVVNGENGVTSELDSYIYWGGVDGLTGERTALPTAGAYDVAAVDLAGKGRFDIIFPSAWVDHHNAGKPRLMHVYEQMAPRRFRDVSERYGLTGVAALAVACEDLNGDGRPELVVANYREEFEYDTASFVYWGTENGFDASSILRLPSHYAMQVVLGDLDGDGFKEILFTGGNKIYIYWNRGGVFRPDDVAVLEVEGNSTTFCQGAVRAEVADVDGDGRNELLVATLEGIEIRAQDDLHRVAALLPMKYCGWVEAVDLDGDGRPELVASRYQNGKTYEAESAVFWNGPAGFESNRVTWLQTAGAVGCTAADLDGDGRPEIIFNNTMRGPSQHDPDLPVYVYLGNEQCEYTPSRRLELPSGGGSNTYVLADLDQDGYADLVLVSSEGLRIFHGGPDGLKPDRYTILPGRGEMIQYVLVGDFNRDGWLDLLAVAYTYDDKPETMANSSVIFYGSASGFSPDHSVVLPTYCGGNAQVADVNRDGWLDIIVYNKRGYLSMVLGGPDGYSEERMWKVPLDVPGVAGVAAITCADLNGDGWLDLIAVVMGHYTRKDSGFYILYGGPDGYAQDKIEFHPTEASSILVSVADLNNDGNLDLLVPAYSTRFTRELPAHIFWGDGKGFDFDHPLVIPCDSSCAFMAIDISGNGYLDLLTVCHRNDLGHQVDSLLFWNGPDGLSFEEVVHLPGLGPHLTSPRDFGNAYTREPLESYISPAYDMTGLKPVRLSWKADIPEKTQIKFQLRWAESVEKLEAAPWAGPAGEDSFYEEPAEEIGTVGEAARWLQYKAILVSLNGCRSPRLEEVRVDFKCTNGITTAATTCVGGG